VGRHVTQRVEPLAEVVLQQVHEHGRIGAGREGMCEAVHGHADRVVAARKRGGGECEGRRGHAYDATDW